MTPIKRPSSGRDYVCVTGASNNGCPANSYCHTGPAREFSKCCPGNLVNVHNLHLWPNINLVVLVTRDSYCCFCCHYQQAPLPSYSMMVATSSSLWQLQMNTQTSQASFRQLTIDNPVIFTALAFDPVNSRIYWGDNYANTISRMPLNGNGGVDIVVGWVKTPFWMSYLVSGQERQILRPDPFRSVLNGSQSCKHDLSFTIGDKKWWCEADG